MPRTPYAKLALTYFEQIQRLKRRGLIVENEAKAIHLLESVSYYRLSGYWYPMLAMPKMDHIFKQGSSFDNAFQLYCFDKELRKIVLGELEKIEVAIRAKMIYELSHRHGAFWYTKPELFKGDLLFDAIFLKIEEEYKRSDEQFIVDFRNKYCDPMPPSWMMLELTSFGTLSRIYKNLKGSNDRRVIAHHFGLDDKTFQSWMHSVVYVRNVCAHHGRLWTRVMRISPGVPSKPQFPFLTHTIKYHPVTRIPLNNNRVYFLISMLLYWLNIINKRNRFKEKLFDLLKKYPMVDISAMGFPDDWEREQLWQ